MRKWAYVAVLCVVLVLSGCAGLAGDTSDSRATEAPTADSPTTATSATEASTPTENPTAEPTAGETFDATVEIHPEKTSFAGRNAVFNGWNLSITVTGIEGADEVRYVVEEVNVQEGNSTYEGVVGTAVGDTAAGGRLSLLQRGDAVTVYAVSDGERRRIAVYEVPSSYATSWDGDRGWADEWRGDPPEEE